MSDSTANLELRCKTRTVIECAAEQFGWTVEQILSPTRLAPIVEARHYAMYVARYLTKHSYPVLAREFNREDHTTVLHAIRKMAGREDTDPRVQQQVNELINRCKVPA